MVAARASVGAFDVRVAGALPSPAVFGIFFEELRKAIREVSNAGN
jgi:hypothetical protein